MYGTSDTRIVGYLAAAYIGTLDVAAKRNRHRYRPTSDVAFWQSGPEYPNEQSPGKDSEHCEGETHSGKLGETYIVSPFL